MDKSYGKKSIVKSDKVWRKSSAKQLKERKKRTPNKARIVEIFSTERESPEIIPPAGYTVGWFWAERKPAWPVCEQ